MVSIRLHHCSGIKDNSKTATNTINMAPASVRKEGAAFDLGLAIGVLAASGQMPTGLLDQYMVMGEVSLDGTLKPIKGALPIAIQARREGFKGFMGKAEPAPRTGRPVLLGKLPDQGGKVFAPLA